MEQFLLPSPSCQIHNVRAFDERLNYRRTNQTLTREWRSGDVVEHNMEMPIRAIWAYPAVRALHGRVALERGPLVYCLEGVDHGGIHLDRIAIDPQRVSNEFHVEDHANLLGVSVLRGKGRVMDESGWENTRLYRK